MIYSDLDETQTAMTSIAQNGASLGIYVQNVQQYPFARFIAYFEWDPFYVQSAPLYPFGPPLSEAVGFDEYAIDTASFVPALDESALQSVQMRYADYYTQTLVPLKNFPQNLALATGAVGTSGILNDLATIGAVQEKLSPGVVPTAMQRQLVDLALSDIVNLITGLQNVLSYVQTGTVNFLGSISADAQIFQNAVDVIKAALADPGWNAKVVATVPTSTLPSIGYEPAGNDPQAIADQITQHMDWHQQEISQLITAQSNASLDLSHLMDLLVGLSSDYSTVAQQATKSADALFGSVLQQIDVAILQAYWQNASAFATAHGFGVPTY